MIGVLLIGEYPGRQMIPPFAAFFAAPLNFAESSHQPPAPSVYRVFEDRLREIKSDVAVTQFAGIQALGLPKAI
jgi:hypothetical protein